MFLKFLILSVLHAVYGAPIIYNYNSNGISGLSRNYLPPLRTVTQLNTFIPRSLVPPAPPVRAVPRVYENQPFRASRVYRAPQIIRRIQPAPTTTRRTYANTNTNINGQSYNYSYGVNDNQTGDMKSAEERLVNGVVRGSYSLTEADGTIRTVRYTADDANGFNAVVERTPANQTRSQRQTSQ